MRKLKYILVAIVFLGIGSFILYWVIDLILQIVSKANDVWTFS